jgi:quercetin dioxygenase-like cupin family protein
MPIRLHASIPLMELPGLRHRTLAGPRDGLRTMEVWRQTIAPGAETPWHRHDCEEVIVILAGRGRLDIQGMSQTFGADSSLILPANLVHRLANDGDAPLELIGVLGMAPVRVETPAGERIALPWDQTELG